MYKNPTERLDLRIPPAVKKKLLRLAKKAKVSITKYLISLIENS